MTPADIRNPSERRYAERLDALGIPWVPQPRLFRFAGKRYTPDFYLPIQETYVEVIGSRQRWHQLRPKAEVFRAHFPDIRFQVVDAAGQPWPWAGPGKGHWRRLAPTTCQCRQCRKTLTVRGRAPQFCSPECRTAHARERFWTLVAKTPGGCWLWQGNNKSGRGEHRYGRTRVDGVSDTVYRHVWRLLRGPIPEGQILLHRCHVDACVNPEHMHLCPKSDIALFRRPRRPGLVMRTRPLTATCCRGHEWTAENTRLWINKRGEHCRICRECDRLRGREYYRRKLSVKRAPRCA